MKVFLQTFGCRANQYDSEQIRAIIKRSGGEIVDDPVLADAALFNSCAVTAEAEVDLRKSVRRAARQNPRLRSVVMGCAAALDQGRLVELPTVESVVPGGDVASVAAALGLREAVGTAMGRQTGTRALMRIQDGCDEHCTFCSTTLARGQNRSRGLEELVREAEVLAAHHPEIVLTGIHIGAYGRDIGTSLGMLVRHLVRSIEGPRFRLSSVEATEVDSELREAFAVPGRLAPHLHAPLQSGSDRVLKRMGRYWYTAASYARAVEKVVNGRSVFGLGADIIAGFPGESDEDHRATVDLVASLPFTYLHVFPYSWRPGTAATRLEKPLPPEVVRDRAEELREVATACATAYRASRIGGDSDVIVVRGDRREGLTEDYLAVDVSGSSRPRGTRLAARLSGTAQRLLAVPT